MSEKKYFLVFIILIFALFFIFTLIPVKTIPANTFKFQLSIFTNADYVLMTVLTILSSLLITTQIYTHRLRKAIIGGTGIGGAGGVLAAIIGTATCASCLAPLFALFGIGFGGVVFVLNFRFHFVAVMILLMLTAIYLTARKINKVCASC